MPKIISAYHGILMKEYTLKGYTSFRKSSYVMNKHKNLFPVDAELRILPTRNKLFGILMNKVIILCKEIIHKK